MTVAVQQVQVIPVHRQIDDILQEGDLLIEELGRHFLQVATHINPHHV